MNKKKCYVCGSSHIVSKGIQLYKCKDYGYQTSALVAQYDGFDTHIKEDSAAYLKSWLSNLKEDAKFIRTVLLDVKKAASIITKRIDDVVCYSR